MYPTQRHEQPSVHFEKGKPSDLLLMIFGLFRNTFWMHLFIKEPQSYANGNDKINSTCATWQRDLSFILTKTRAYTTSVARAAFVFKSK